MKRSKRHSISAPEYRYDIGDAANVRIGGKRCDF